MNADWSQYQTTLALSAAGFLFLLQMALSIALGAVTALSRVALHRLSSEDGQQVLASLREPPSKHRAAIALLRQLCLMGGLLLLVVAGKGAGWRYPGITGIVLGTLIGVLVLEFFVARPLALWEPRVALRYTAFLVRPAYALTYPIVHPLGRILNGIYRMQQSSEDEREEEQDEEVEAFIEVGEREGILEANEGEMMRSIVDLDETLVREIMTPRTDIVALNRGASVTDARAAVLRAEHSRLPVYGESIDEVVGVIHERDLLRAWEADGGDRPVTDYVREVMFVPEHLCVADLLAEMRVKSHIALVVDEYGGIAGLVTLEDLLEEIVGDIREEHDREDAPFLRQDDGSWIIKAAEHVEELHERFGVEFEERDFDTIGGLVVSALGACRRKARVWKFRGCGSRS